MHERHIGALAQGVTQVEELSNAHKTLRRLERFWTQAVELGSRNTAFTSAA
jgi:hypothetical protein